MPETATQITSETVRADFNAIEAILHYTRAAHSLGLWESERVLIERFFRDHSASLLEAGCGAGRATLGLWELGFRNITAFDFAAELLEQAESLAAERGAAAIRFLTGDACALPESITEDGRLYAGALFLFNGLMQIPGRANRRAAMREIHRACVTGAPFIFTTHDRNDTAAERRLWAAEAVLWAEGRADPRLGEFGDRYMTSTEGRIFMHLPDQSEIREDLAATGWDCEFTEMRRKVARESRAVLDFSDDCRFWVARKRRDSVLPVPVHRV